MKDGPNVVRIAALIGDHARADMLTALMSGRALTATELAAVAGITKQTASSHLGKLREGGLVTSESVGRHRYFRLADEDVASLLEKLMGVAYRTGAVRLRSSPREPALRKARVCYDHLAGELGVLILDGLKARDVLRLRRGPTPLLQLTENGRRYFHEFGIDVQALSAKRRPLCRLCLDWSMRRYHLAGTLGAAIFRRCLELRWAQRELSSRVVNFSPRGEKALRAHFQPPESR